MDSDDSGYSGVNPGLHQLINKAVPVLYEFIIVLGDNLPKLMVSGLKIEGDFGGVWSF